MAPSAGSFYQAVARNYKVLRLAAKQTSRFIENAVFARSQPSQQPILVRNAGRQPLHPAAFLRQSKRWLSSNGGFTGAVRRFASTSSSHGKPRYDRSTFPASQVSLAVARSTGRAPFASTLRPNLTGGAFRRTAGGYTLGSGQIGGARSFSHGPAAAGEVVNNVSQAVRAFFLNGQKVQFDGVNPRTGSKRYKAVTALREEATRKMNAIPKTSPGSFVDFKVNPTITAFASLTTVAGFPSEARKETLNTEGLLDILSVDFSRSLKELAVILNDIKKLSALGDLPITYVDNTLRVHFPGFDSDTVERLMAELELQRGLVGQDSEFDAYVGTDVALLFPFAPSKSDSECSFYGRSVEERQYEAPPLYYASTPEIQESVCSLDYSTQSDIGEDFGESDAVSFLSSSGPSCSERGDSSRPITIGSASRDEPWEFSDTEGIHRFIQQIDTAARR